MKLMRLIGAISVAGMLAPVLVGTAAADSAAISTSGPNSDQSVTVSNSSSYQSLNVNETKANSINVQGASSGNTSAGSNTTVGGLGSGNASNNSSTSTVVANTNSMAVTPGLGSSSASPIQQPAVGAGAASSSKPVAAPGKGGSVLGASTTAGMGGGEAILPVTGPIVPVDVSAIRAAWHPQSAAVSGAAKRTNLFTAGMLITATLLSLLGAAGSTLYTRRKERRV